MKVDPANPHWEDRDRFVLSKGHAAPVVYSALAEKRLFPEGLASYGAPRRQSPSGPPRYEKTPGIDMTSGSLGNGLSAALGMAIYLNHQKKGVSGLLHPRRRRNSGRAGLGSNPCSARHGHRQSHRDC